MLSKTMPKTDEFFAVYVKDGQPIFATEKWEAQNVANVFMRSGAIVQVDTITRAKAA